MIENSVVRARIDAATKAEASAVLASIGLTVSDAVRVRMPKVAIRLRSLTEARSRKTRGK